MEAAKPLRGLRFDEERALYGLHDAELEGCAFAGPADGESALKECHHIQARNCRFDLRYPLWHCHDFVLEGARMSGLARAALWYDRGGVVRGSHLGGIKALRECSDIALEDCDVVSPEFGWKCNNVRMSGCRLEAEYAFLDSADVQLRGVEMQGKYSFQYVRSAEIRNSVLTTKDAFWHSTGVTVRDSVLVGEYLGWYSEGLTLINCRIEGTQPLCYCRNLTLVNCTMVGCDLAFEYSEVEADVRGRIDSVKNPRSGHIVADEIGQVVREDAVLECACQVELR